VVKCAHKCNSLRINATFVENKINFLTFLLQQKLALVIIVYFSVTLKDAQRGGALLPLFFQKGGKGGGDNFSSQYHGEFHG